MKKAIINRAIKPLGLEIQGNRRDGYFYFTDLFTGEQIGQSVFVCYLKQLTLAQWQATATAARREFELNR